MSFTINGTTGINLGTQPLTGNLPDANAPSGSVLQVIQSESIIQQAFSSNSVWTAINPSATITPISTSSKILVAISIQATNHTNGLHVQGRIYRNGSNIKDMGLISFGSPNTNDYVYYLSLNYLDSPSSTSALTYQIYTKLTNGSTGAWYVNDSQGLDSGEDPISTITLMEISG